MQIRNQDTNIHHVYRNMNMKVLLCDVISTVLMECLFSNKNAYKLLYNIF